ncbi:hypothetical protein BLNAU_4516 [Blattamonas nauphoetae]|uniref:Transmembrane protein n=1 Tax=Blattamonas nauphoetae TaxID=2049346 RepID=A0ABQ9YA25_9EUKA|nr:hypothetical protein BLNAU_4516 [Blattamonas nauphoetae]
MDVETVNEAALSFIFTLLFYPFKSSKTKAIWILPQLIWSVIILIVGFVSSGSIAFSILYPYMLATNMKKPFSTSATFLIVDGFLGILIVLPHILGQLDYGKEIWQKRMKLGEPISSLLKGHKSKLQFLIHTTVGSLIRLFQFGYILSHLFNLELMRSHMLNKNGDIAPVYFPEIVIVLDVAFRMIWWCFEISNTIFGVYYLFTIQEHLTTPKDQ